MLRRFYKNGQVYTGTNALDLEYIDAEVKPDNCVDSVMELLPEGHPRKPIVEKKVAKTAPKTASKKASRKRKVGKTDGTNSTKPD